MDSEIFSEFFSAIPAGFVFQVCCAGLLFIFYLTWALYIRPQQRRKKEVAEAQASAGPGFVTAPQPMTTDLTSDANPITLDDLKAASSSDVDEEDLPPMSSFDTGDLPPLDDLLIDEIEEPAPPSQPEQSTATATTIIMPTYREITDQAHQVKLNRGDTTEAKEILTIMRDEDDGRLMILIGDKGFRTISEDADAKNTFKKVMKELSAVITKPDEKPLRQSEPEKPEPEPMTQGPVEQPKSEPKVEEPPATLGDLAMKKPEEKTPPPVEEKRTTTTMPPPPMPSGAMPGDLPSFKLEDNPAKETQGRFGRKKMEYEPVPELDIAGAIEAYLQYKMQHSDEFRGRNIHVLPSITGGVRIQVDDTSYAFVDEIEDEAVRAFLQETIAEWQDRQ